MNYEDEKLDQSNMAEVGALGRTANYATQAGDAKMAALAYSLAQDSLPGRLRRELERSQAETQRLKKLIDLLEKNPDTQQILELMNRKEY